MKNKKNRLRTFLNYSILLLIILIISATIIDVFLSKKITSKFIIGDYVFENKTIINKGVNIKYPSYFRLKFYYPKAEFKNKEDWQSLLGGNPFINGNILNPGANTHFTVSSSTTKNEKILLESEVTGSFLCGPRYICRLSEQFFLEEGMNNLKFNINNSIIQNHLWKYKLVVIRSRNGKEYSKVSNISKVSSIFKVKSFNHGIMGGGICLLLLVVFLRGIQIIYTIFTKVLNKKS